MSCKAASLASLASRVSRSTSYVRIGNTKDISLAPLPEFTQMNVRALRLGLTCDTLAQQKKIDQQLQPTAPEQPLKPMPIDQQLKPTLTDQPPCTFLTDDDLPRLGALLWHRLDTAFHVQMHIFVLY